MVFGNWFGRDSKAQVEALSAKVAELELEQKNSPVYAIQGAQRQHGDLNTASNYEQLAKEAWANNPYVRACTELLGSNMAMLPIELKDANGELIEKHKILDILERPNSMQSKQQFWEQWSVEQTLGGSTFLHANGPDLEPPVNNKPEQTNELYSYRPDLIQIKAGGHTGVPTAYVYAPNQNLRFPVDQINGNSRIWHIKLPNALDGSPFTTGTPPVKGCVREINYYNSGMTHNNARFENGVSMSGMFVFTDPAFAATQTVEQMRDWHALINEQYQGALNAGRVMVVNGMEFKQFGGSLKDMDFQNGMQEAARRIATAIYRTPSQLLNIPGEQTYSNYETAMLAYWQQTIIPMGQRIVDALNHWFVPQFDDSLKLSINLEKVDALATLMSAKFENALKGAGFLTVNDQRRMVNEEPLDEAEADQVLIPAGLLPLTLSQDKLEDLKALIELEGYSTPAVQSIVKECVVQMEAKECDHGHDNEQKEVAAFYDAESGKVLQLIDGEYKEL